jgi:hypothetical protein
VTDFWEWFLERTGLWRIRGHRRATEEEMQYFVDFLEVSGIADEMRDRTGTAPDDYVVVDDD